MPRPVKPIVLPGFIQEPSGLMVPISMPLEPAEPVPPGVLPEPDLVVRQREPSWFDQTGAYATPENLGVPLLPAEHIVDIVRALPFQATMMMLCALQRVVGGAGDPAAIQGRLVDQLLGAGSEPSARAHAFLRTHGRSAVFFEQQLYVTQRLVFLHADLDSRAELTAQQAVQILAVLLSVPDSVIDAAVPLPRSMARVQPQHLLEAFVAGGEFVHREWFGSSLIRAVGVFIDRACDADYRSDPQYCDLAAWFAAEYDGATLEQFIGVGMGLAAGSNLFDDEEPLRPVLAEAMRPHVGPPLDAIANALVADPLGYRREIAATQGDPRHAARDIVPFHQHPFWRHSGGGAVPIGPRVVQGALSDRGLHFRFLDIARSHGDPQQYTNFIGRPYERYIVEITQAAHHRPATTTPTAGRVFGEQPYLKKKQNHFSPDVMIDYGLDFVAIEMTSSRMTQPSLVEGNSAKIRSDIDKLITDKLVQLDAAIRDLRHGRVTLHDVNFDQIKRFWPILVITEPVFQTDILWDHVLRSAAKRLFNQSRVQPVTLFEIDDYEALIAEVSVGTSMIGMLERKTAPLWQRRDFRSWALGDHHAPRNLGRHEGERQFVDTTNRLLRAIGAPPLDPDSRADAVAS